MTTNSTKVSSTPKKVEDEPPARCRRCGAEKKKSELYYGRCREKCRVLSGVKVDQLTPDDKCIKCGCTSDDLVNGRCEDCRPRTSGKMNWQKMTDEEVVQTAKDAIASEGYDSRSALQAGRCTLYVELLKRGLMERIGLEKLAKFGHGKGTETNNPPDKHCYLCRNYIGSDLQMRGINCTCGCHIGGSRR